MERKGEGEGRKEGTEEKKEVRREKRKIVYTIVRLYDKALNEGSGA